MIGNVSTERLVLDPDLQCRVELDQGAIGDYASAMKDAKGWPARMPPLRAWRIDGGEDLFLTDGWHRQAAAQLAKLDEVPVDIRDGNRREAVLDAVGANGLHGLRRKHEDVRRAVTVLLRDPEWCKLSSRGLAKHAKTSHTHVNNVRKRYGLKRGQQLTSVMIRRVEGRPTVEWERILKDASFAADDVEKIRVAQSFEQVERAGRRHCGYSEPTRKAIYLRLHELAAEREPQDIDFDAVDTVEDIEAAILDPLCPDRPKLLRIRRAFELIKKATSSYALDQFQGDVQGRPALEQSIEVRRAELKAEEANGPRTPWKIRQEIEDEQDPERQAELLREVDDLAQPTWSRLGQPARQVYRDRIAVDHEVADCPDPLCDGFHKPKAESWMQECHACRRTPTQVQERMEEALVYAGRLLEAGRTIPIPLSVPVTPEALSVLEIVAAALQDENFCAWITGPAGPPALAPTLLAWERAMRKAELLEEAGAAK